VRKSGSIGRTLRKTLRYELVENLEEIGEKGMKKFLEHEEEKYECQSCRDVVSVHDGKCYACGYMKLSLSEPGLNGHTPANTFFSSRKHA